MDEVLDAQREYEGAMLDLSLRAAALQKAQGTVETATAAEKANAALSTAEAAWLKVARLYRALAASRAD
jgi:hypothetical protein